MDVIIVRYLARKAKKLAAKWGGQCIVFIDEIDAVGRRRSVSLHRWRPRRSRISFSSGRHGALNPSGDMILETRAWRDKLFAARAPEPRPRLSFLDRIFNQGIAGGMMGGGGGQLALNQLLIVMDGVDNPPLTRRVFTNKINQLLDASYIIPRRIRSRSMRLPRAKPRGDQIYFIGATNIPIEQLDPALTRPGRMGRHVWFRTPTKQDRLDIFDLYLGKVAHEPDLDRPERRDEIARITSGYSPAMIEQVCSLALTYAHHEGKVSFEWSAPRRGHGHARIRNGDRRHLRPRRDPRRRDPRGRARGRRARLHEGRESVRVSIRMRGGSLGHHQALEKEERFSRFRSEEIGLIIWGLGSMAAERVFYGETTNGVGGDLQTVTAAAAWMVGASGMGPEYVEVNGYRQNGRPAPAPAGGQAARGDHAPLRGDRRPHHEPGQLGRRRSQPDRRHPRRPRQAAHGRADHRPGVHEGAPPDAPQQGQGRADRQGRDREEGDLRRRADRPVERSQPAGSRSRSTDERVWPVL
jgi:hypothetical protein